MPLLYKPDWETTKERFRAWWAGEGFGRCLLSVTAPLAHPSAVSDPGPACDPQQRWTDLDYISALNAHQHATTFYGGEAFPVWTGGYPGLSSIAVFLGAPITLEMDTGWKEPILTADEWDATTLRFDRSNERFLFARSVLERAVKECKGKSIPSMGAIGTPGDSLAAIRGNENLLYDVALCPDKVRSSNDYLCAIWEEVYTECYNIVRDAAEGCASWMPIWAPGTFYPLQCDFSYMISERMFSSIFMPEIERQTRFLDYTIYHVDGTGAFRHAAALCELPRLRALQILPGAGKPSPLFYLDTLRLVQAKGKGLYITVPPQEVETALQLLSADGLLLETSCETEEQARCLIKQVETWSRVQPTARTYSM